MTSHEEWFSNLEKSEQLGVVETRDDTSHPIEHVGEVPLNHVGQNGVVGWRVHCKKKRGSMRI